VQEVIQILLLRVLRHVFLDLRVVVLQVLMLQLSPLRRSLFNQCNHVLHFLAPSRFENSVREGRCHFYGNRSDVVGKGRLSEVQLQGSIEGNCIVSYFGRLFLVEAVEESLGSHNSAFCIARLNFELRRIELRG